MRTCRGCRSSDWEACTPCWEMGLPKWDLGQNDPSSSGGQGRHTQTQHGWVGGAGGQVLGAPGGAGRTGLASGCKWPGWEGRPGAPALRQVLGHSFYPQFFFSHGKQVAPLTLAFSGITEALHAGSLCKPQHDPQKTLSSRWVGKSTSISCFPTLDSLQPCQKALAQQLGKKNNKQLPDWKEEVKLFPFSDDIILCIEHTHESTKNNLN